MPAHPKFSGKYISEEEHEECLSRLDLLVSRFVNPVLDGFDLCDKGRWHKSPDAPCLYIFRNMKMYEEELRSLFMHIQETEVPNEIEVVFRKKGKFSPLDEAIWRRLTPDRWQKKMINWKSIHVNNQQSISEARRLIALTIESYDNYYGE